VAHPHNGHTRTVLGGTDYQPVICNELVGVRLGPDLANMGAQIR